MENKNNTPPVTSSDQGNKKQERKIHALLVLVIFQALLILSLFIAIVYKFIDIASDL
tara:strand:+ start:3197 stop:3367 length:171 start_codon:yes stop_codon:yes gene_type:complete